MARSQDVLRGLDKEIKESYPNGGFCLIYEGGGTYRAMCGVTATRATTLEEALRAALEIAKERRR